jgi:hypothetical protein
MLKFFWGPPGHSKKMVFFSIFFFAKILSFDPGNGLKTELQKYSIYDRKKNKLTN